MRAYKILPVEIKVRDFNLSKQALKRLEWMDWYMNHGENARLTCRHFGISPDTFYLWKRRFNPFDLLKQTQFGRIVQEGQSPQDALIRVGLEVYKDVIQYKPLVATPPAAPGR